MAGTYSPTYDSLTQEISQAVEDSSPEFTGNFDNMLGRAELRVLRDLDLKVFDVDVTGTLTSGQREQDKPDGTVKLVSLFLTVGGELVPADPRSRDFMKMVAPDVTVEDTPRWWDDLDEAKFYVAPTPDAAYGYNATINRRPAALSASNQTNWLTDNVPDLLYNALQCEAHRFLIEDGAFAAQYEITYVNLLDRARYELRGMTRSEYKPMKRMPYPSAERGD